MKEFKKGSYVVLLECENVEDYDGLELNYCYRLDSDSDGDGISVYCDVEGESSAWDADDLGEYELREATEEEIAYYEKVDHPFDVDDIPRFNPNNRRAYISCPIGEPLEELEKVKKALVKVGYSPYHWIRGEKYPDDILDNCGIFVLMVNYDEFSFNEWNNMNILAKGCLREARKARKLRKPLYLAYKSSRGYRMYEITWDERDESFCVHEGDYIKFTVLPVPDNYSIF